MKQETQESWRPTLESLLAGLVVLGLGGLFYYAAGLIPAGLAAAYSGEVPDAGLDAALGMGALICSIAGCWLLWSALRQARLSQLRRRRATVKTAPDGAALPKGRR